MYKLDITPAAIRDQETALDYIAGHLQNPIAAAALLDEIENCYHTLEDNPFLFPLCSDGHLAASGYHKAVIKRYILIYKIDTGGGVVHIMRFVYGPSDYSKLL